MDWSAGLSWLAALRDRHERDFADADRADMGTAFGLDASFGPAEVESASVTQSPSTAGELRLAGRSRL